MPKRQLYQDNEFFYVIWLTIYNMCTRYGFVNSKLWVGIELKKKKKIINSKITVSQGASDRKGNPSMHEKKKKETSRHRKRDSLCKQWPLQLEVPTSPYCWLRRAHVYWVTALQHAGSPSSSLCWVNLLDTRNFRFITHQNDSNISQRLVWEMLPFHWFRKTFLTRNSR